MLVRGVVDDEIDDDADAALSAAVYGEAGTPQAVAESAETRLALARAQIVSGALDGAAGTLADLAGGDPADWRITWYQGLRELAAGQPAAALAAFGSVYDEVPAAARYFGRVWTVDRSYVSAAFGLARVRLAADDRPGAIAALAAVPQTSVYHVAAQIMAIRIHLAGAGQPGVSTSDLREAAGLLTGLTLDAAGQQQLTAQILRAALDRVAAGQPAGTAALLGCEPTERALRFGLEQSYRSLARLAPDEARRIGLVDRANEIRPRTWL